MNRILSILVITIALLLQGCGEGGDAAINQKVNTALNATKQKWFDRFHPIGTATRIQLHDVQVAQTSTGRKTTARFTLYWEGPVTKDGFTKIQAVYDSESNRWVRAEILETNGITNTQTIEGLGEIIGGIMDN